jgi:hypothetical protein
LKLKEELGEQKLNYDNNTVLDKLRDENEIIKNKWLILQDNNKNLQSKYELLSKKDEQLVKN